MYLIFACTLLHSEPMSASAWDPFFLYNAFTGAIIGCCIWNACMLLLKIIFLILLDLRPVDTNTYRYRQLN